MDLAVLEQGMALLILSFLYLAAGKPFMPARQEPGFHKHYMKSVPGWRIFKRLLIFHKLHFKRENICIFKVKFHGKTPPCPVL